MIANCSVGTNDHGQFNKGKSQPPPLLPGKPPQVGYAIRFLPHHEGCQETNLFINICVYCQRTTHFRRFWHCQCYFEGMNHQCILLVG